MNISFILSKCDANTYITLNMRVEKILIWV